MPEINDAYSPHTGEHIRTDDPADWMGRAGTPAPNYNQQTQACFWRDDAWAVVDVVPEPHYKTQFSVLEFRDRFTLEEQLAIRQAQFNDMEVGLVYDSFQAAQFIDIEEPRVEQGIDLYIAKGLLAPERKAQLLEPELIEP